jgi:hypothetical protein
VKKIITPLNFSFTLNPFIFISKKSDTPATMVHEEKHIEQQAKTGLIKFLWKYFTDKDYRYQVELEAYAAEIKSQPQGSDWISFYANCKLYGSFYKFDKSVEQIKEDLLKELSK